MPTSRRGLLPLSTARLPARVDTIAQTEVESTKGYPFGHWCHVTELDQLAYFRVQDPVAVGRNLGSKVELLFKC